MPASAADRLLALLKRLAAAGERCPSHAVIGRNLDIGSHGAAMALGELERAGLVRVARGPTGKRVTIVATRAQTALPGPRRFPKEAVVAARARI